MLSVAEKVSEEPDVIISINPSDETELGRVIADDRTGVDEVVARAGQAFKSWSMSTMEERRRLLQRLQQEIVRDKLVIAELISREQGKPVAEAIAAEVVPVLAILKELRHRAPRQLRDERVANEMILFSHKKSGYRFVPHGVLVVISPWNFPFSVAVPEIAAALIAGNTVVFKPAPHSVLVGKKIEQLFIQAGFPQDVMNVVYLQDSDAPYLTEHPGVNKIIFTGSTAVGCKVMTSAAKTVKPVVLELGGKDPAIVAADADLERAARGIVWGAMFTSGQVCASVERVYVEKPVAERFIQACLDEIAKLRVGDPLDEGVDIGPISTRSQLEKVKDQVEDAIARGAVLRCGGRRIGDRGYFFQPTLLTEVNHTMKVMTEETFGPILPIMVVQSLDEAIRLANECEYGLSAFGWTSNRATAKRLMRELYAGTVLINDSTMTWGEPSAPWVGFKHSGIGLTRSRFGLLEMVQIKYVSYDPGGNERNLWWFPYDNGKNLFAAACDLLYRPLSVAKLNGLKTLLTSRRFVTSVHWPTIIKNLHRIF